MRQISQLLRPETISVGLNGTTKEDVLDALVSLLAEHPAVTDIEQLRQDVVKREKMMSTGVGKGLGLPHAKSAAVTDNVAAFAVTTEPVPFGAIDNQPVRLLFLLVGTEEDRSQHIKILSRISRLMNQDAFRDRLLHASDVEQVLAIIEEGELSLLEG